jgi:lipid-A-disaccharide synthase
VSDGPPPAREVVLVSNGPGELHAWARPVLDALRRLDPDLAVRIALIPCQFASGREADIAATFGADAVTSRSDFLRTVPTGRAPAGLGAERGVVLQVGGAPAYGAALAARLGHPYQRYAYTAGGHRRLDRLYLPDERTARRARRAGTPAGRVEVVGNLAADALAGVAPAADPGRPHVMVVPGSRDAFARVLVPLMLQVVDELARLRPDARFVWPLSRMLSEATVRDAIAGVEKDVLGGVAGRRDGDVVVTPGGARVEILPEEARYAHMRAADLAITIPGTNTLELGIAGVPSLVVLPMNAPERIPMEGIGHWLGLVPLIGRPLKRWAARLYVEGFDQPVSLPNRITGEPLFVEVAGIVDGEDLARRADAMLADPDDLARRRARLAETMPTPGAAARLARRVLERLEAPA